MTFGRNHIIMVRYKDQERIFSLKKIIISAMMSTLLLTAACTANTGSQALPTVQNEGGSKSKGESGLQSFAEAHDAFETKLTEQWNDQDPIPEPPEGVFELDYYDSKVGKLAAYVSSDPDDGQKHPLMIWVVGGWGNSIDEFAWSYPDWENDQTASAFREEGILMMYPSFRGGNGNPGYYETLFGEVDDIVSAYEYAAALPYVDPQRIYLGGHSTGGTRVLLASEYTDKFRAVFSFGPVDEVKYHNKTQFTFDTKNAEEYTMRSPIHWLSDVQNPTFIMEGKDGNSSNLRNIEKKSDNDNIHCYVVDGADHFSVLAPVTRLVARKISEDTGSDLNITITDEELKEAMNQTPVKSYPVMKPYHDDEAGFRVKVPAIWEAFNESEEFFELSFISAYEDDNFWDASMMMVYLYSVDDGISLDDYIATISYDGAQYQGEVIPGAQQDIFVADCVLSGSDGSTYYSKIAAVQRDGELLEFEFFTPEEYREDADVMFHQVIDSIELE